MAAVIFRSPNPLIFGASRGWRSGAMIAADTGPTTPQGFLAYTPSSRSRTELYRWPARRQLRSWPTFCSMNHLLEVV